jgi:two-component system C4-dicarboxylate transport sensor histidine kinase DctB
MARIAEVLRCGTPVRFTDERGGLVGDNTLHPVLDSRNQVTGVVVFVRDITECRRAQQELQEYQESTRDAERLASLGMISATLAHEITQPLSVVRLAIQNAAAELEKLDCPDVVKQDLQAGLAASAQMAGIAHRFRDSAKQPAKAKEVEVRVEQVAQKTFRLLAQSAKLARVSFQTENLDTLPAIRMRENDLDQLFFALAQNAVQAADGKRNRRLLVTGALQEDTVILQFQDNCGGIAPAHLSRLFEPFFTTKPSGQGTGLGLCIARRIACQRGGQIAVKSRQGEGTTFTVTLPREWRPGMEGRYVR